MGFVIGIVGGLGPYAGLDLVKKLHDSVDVHTDQDYPDVIMVSAPRVVPDRSRFVLDPNLENPALGILYCVEKLANAGVTHLGIPCNTAHAPVIMNQIRAYLSLHSLQIQLLDIVWETYSFAKAHLKSGKIGLLATPGTYASRVYPLVFESEAHFELLTPDDAGRASVFEAVYSREFGIKARSNPVSDIAVETLTEVCLALREQGAEAVIMGCTEIPLALGRVKLGFPLLDPALILARALIKAVLPQRLKPLEIQE
jgi:aspartate racemase